MRYRLWDINLVVRRTVSYGLLTAALLLIYISSVTVLQGLFTAVSSKQSAVAIALSTIIIAALFNPLRRRLQDLIDHRFYRQKYDSVRILDKFAKVARDKVALERLEVALLSAVREAMQPEQSSIWLKKKWIRCIDRGHDHGSYLVRPLFLTLIIADRLLSTHQPEAGPANEPLHCRREDGNSNGLLDHFP